MIVRNEEKRVEACLRSIAPYVDEMVVVDTGSSDRTCEIASACGARVFQMPWPDSFAAARNESLQHARGQWVFWMDADDVIPPECGAALREVVERDPERRAAYQVAVRLPAGPGEFSDAVVDHIKLFPNRADLRFEHRIHEQILPAVRRAGLEVVPTELYVIHRNYDRSPDGQAMKRHRDFRLLDLDLRDRPEHPFVLFNLGMTHLHATKEFEVAANYLQRSLVQSHPADSIVRKAHAMLTTTYVCREEWEDAALANEAGRQVYPDDAELLFQAGQIYQQLGRFDDARAALERLVAGGEDQHYRSVDVGLRTYRGHHELALLFRRMGDLAHCEGILQDLVRSHPDFAPARLDLVETLARLGRLGEARLELSRVAEDEVTRAHIQRLWHLVGPPTWPDEVPTPLGSRDSDSPLGRLAARYPYPLPEPRVSRHEHGWLQAPTREALAQVLSPATRVVLELGSWLGLSTRFVADCAPNATVIAVDHWQGSVEHQQNPELAALLAVLYETFIANCWDYRERIVPVRRTTLDGMAEMAELGVEPDVVYIDGSHDTESVRADLETALDRFPNATVVGDDWFGEGVQQAVQAVITARQLDSRFGHNATAWWIVPEGGPPGRAFAFRGSRYAYCRLTREMAMNERAVSLALALAAVESCHGPVLELGNVLESYGRTGHIVADAEGDADLRHVGVDQFGRDTRFDAIVSVSLTDYLVGVDRRACDLDRADRLLRWVVGGLLRPGGTALICVPLGIWPDLDRMILAGPQGYDVTCMRRITAANDWQEIPLGELGPPAYGMPYEFANAIAVLSIGFPCGRIAEGCSHASDPASVTPSVGERLTPPDWDAAPEFGRREGLLAALKSLWALRPGPSVLVETGTLRDADPSARESDGWSTLAWGWYAQATGGRAVTVDAASEAIDVCRELTHSYSNAIEYVNADSVSFLVEWERRYPDVRIDLLYLDSFDYFDRPASEAHNLREVETALPHLADLCLVLLDDTHPAEPTAPETSPKGFWGKGARTVPFLLERGFHLEWHREGQVLLARRASQQSLS